MATIEERLEQLEASTKHLEKSQKRYRLTAVALLCLMVAGVSMGQADQLYNLEPLIPSLLKGFDNGDFQELSERASSQRSPKQAFNVIRANEVQITTATGQVVGVFGTDNNRAVFALLNRFGSPILALGENAEGNGSTNTYNKDSKRVSIISVDSNGNGGLDVYTKNEKRAASVNVGPSGSGSLEVFNSSEKRVAYLGVDSNENGTLEASDKKANLRSIIGVTTAGDGGMNIFNQNDKFVAALTVDPDGNGALNGFDKNGNLRSVVGVDPDGNGGVATFDRNGVIIASQSIQNGIPGDLDSDGDVDFSDFLTFAQNFGKR